MALKYREDPDLAFLKRCEAEDLETLFWYLTHDSEGNSHRSGALMKHPDIDIALSEDPPAYHDIWELMAAELQLFGGNTFSNAFRRKGVPYRELLCDVCGVLKVKIDKSAAAFEIESAMLQHVFKQSWENLSDEERLSLLVELELDPESVDLASVDSVIGK